MDKAAQQAVDAIIKQLEAGSIPWRKPWKSGLPTNVVTQRPYRGMNVIFLAMQGYASKYWLTYKQAASLGGYVMKGEKGTLITKYGVFTPKDKETGEEGRRRGYFTSAVVFNIAQCNPELGTALGLTNQEPVASLPEAEKVWENYTKRPKLEQSSNAWYSPARDLIGMPSKDSFTSAEEFYCTLFHEMAHSTGHKDRLNRDAFMERTVFGSNDYSNEELVAEFASSMLCGQCGIAPAVMENSAAYISGWLTKLKLADNKQVLIKAVSAAQKAVDFIIGEAKHENTQETTNEEPLRASAAQE